MKRHVKPAAGRAGKLVGILLALVAPLAGCSLAPVYTPPHTTLLPMSYKGTGPFVLAHPDDELAHGPWWNMFGNTELDQLETELDAANPDLKAAQETYTQARDVVAEARSQLFPQLSAQAFASQNAESAHTLFHSLASSPSLPLEEASLGYGAAASWEPDFWGEIRNRTNFAKASAQATAALVATARLSLEMELASDYMMLRGLDAQQAVYTNTLGYYRDAVNITRLRYTGKIGSGLDLERARDQLATAQAADTDIEAQRAVLEHAIAVLAGQNPSTFSLPPGDLKPLTIPVIPVGVPSELLQRRPDIAASEREMAAANAAIGVARAAFYPNIRLSASFGFEDNGIGLASLPDSLWSVGASALLPLFEGGLRRAEEQQSWSSLHQAADTYRSTVLKAFQQVEDQLSLTTKLATEYKQQSDAVRASVKAQDIAMQLYTSGLNDYLNVTVAQIAALNAELSKVQVKTRRLQAAVDLIGAVGGGWSAQDLPTPDQTVPFQPIAMRTSPQDEHTR
ncbi:efflux transporter outer membrane subunit [Paraburkholderia rhizosphaerae]|uniref:NodT family efflux transporter outer membrane factor (OMF) lipoprotein n=1 Tax=Paraburkholderia rhizosphaerae TaxID=480658 RepID=A0A4R8M088_9BURK|nr:efflux transporter outer membrane subunit [Paraburkholderia rhizosphaerae]TDY54222.1 NodT family efflux transporter outer membrane factor (OMF) lipoprotein [Paraburkholderia rhizosphaerae]